MLMNKAPKELSDEQLTFIGKARKSLGDIATRTELKELNGKLRKRKASPFFITKNTQFKTSIRGAYNLAMVDGKAAANAALRAFQKERTEEEAPKRKPAAHAKSHNKRGSRAASA